MRDPELMRDLLEEMANEIDGEILVPRMEGDEARRRHHHADLLADCGHAEWITLDSGGDPSMLRITNAGYDFLQAIQHETDGPKRWNQVLAWVREGVAWSDAAARLVDSLKGLMSEGHPV